MKGKQTNEIDKEVIGEEEEITKEDLSKIKEEIKQDKETAIDEKVKKKKQFRWPWKKKQQLSKSLKKRDEILVFLINLKRELEGPVLTKIYGGNFLVIRNRVYRYKPSDALTFMGKYKVAVAREFDRRLIGIDDYEELMMKDMLSKNPGDRVNINDPVIIKAIIQARLGEKQNTLAGKQWIMWVVVGAIAIIGVFLFMKSGKTPIITGAAVPAA